MNLNLPVMEEDSLPNPETIIKGFEIIETTPLENLSYSDIKQIFENSLGIIPKIVVPNATFNAPLYRVTDGLFTGFDKNRISYFSHPPAAYCKKGRANLTGFPVFYAALSGDTALREFRNSSNEPLKSGDIIYLSEWKVKKGANVSYTQFIYDESIKLGEKIIDINSANQEKLARISSVYSSHKQKAFKLLTEKLGSLYISDRYYFASSFLSHYLLYEDREGSPITIDVLLYPSVQAGFKGINYAFHPEFIKDNIELKAIQKVSFNSFHEGKSSLSFLELGLPKKNGSIRWYTINIDTKSIQRVKNFVFFDNAPPIEALTEDVIFHSENKNVQHEFNDLIKLGWKLLEKHNNETLNQLANIEENINYRKTYKKQLSINISNENIFTEFNGTKYKVMLVAFELKYKLRLEEI